MKKFLGLIVVLCIAAFVFFWFASKSRSGSSAAAFLPGKTAAFFEFPDFRATARAVKESPLGAIFADPAIAPFLQKPASRALNSPHFAKARAELIAVKPTSFFVAVISLSEGSPELLVGFRYAGEEEAVAAALRRMFAWIENAEGSANSVRESIENGRRTFTQQIDNTTLAAFLGAGWCLITNAPGEADDFLTAATVGSRADSLAQNPLYAELAKQHPSHIDFLAYAALPPWLALLEQEAARQSAHPIPGQMDALRKMRGGMYFVSVEKKATRELSVIAFTEALQPVIVKNAAMRFAPENTLVYYAAAIDTSMLKSAAQEGDLPTPVSAFFSMIGLSAEDAASIPGNELGMFFWWPETSLLPSAALSLEISNPEAAAKLWQGLTLLGGRNLNSQTFEDWRILTIQNSSLGLLAPTFALGNERLLITLSPNDFAKLLETAKSGKNLEGAKAFQHAERAFSKPTNAQFGFIDLPGILRRAYLTLQPMLRFAANLNPVVGELVDLDRLPAADAIAAHLSPIVSTQRIEGNQLVTEVHGNITFSTLVAGFAAEAAEGFQILEKVGRQ